MSDQMEHIEFSALDLQIRDAELREVYGRIVPFGERITIRGRPESFQKGAFSHLDPKATRLLSFHDQRTPIGRMLDLEEKDDGAYATFKVAKTRAGDEMLELLSSEVLDTFSIGFIPGQQSKDGVHKRVSQLPEVSLVTFGAYESAKVLAVREKEIEEMPENETQVDVLTREDAAVWDKRMDDIQTRIESLVALMEAPDPKVQNRAQSITPVRWFDAMVQSEFNNKSEKLDRLNEEFQELLETRAPLADVVGEFPENVPADDASGIVVEQFIASQLVNVLDSRRQLFRNLGSFPMPRSGYAKIPVWTTHTLVAARSGQKTDANSRKPVITGTTFEAQWYDGAVDIALELIRTAELPVLEMIWNDLLGQYAIATEAGVVATVEAGGAGFTYTGTALRTDTYENFANDVATQAIEVREDSGAPATKLAVTKAQWPLLVAMVDANDRRQFATTGAQNSDAQVNLNAEQFTLPGGIDVFYVPGITQAFIYNGESLKGADGGPERVEAVNVLEMGRDVGLLGRTMFVPRIPGAVKVFGVDPEAS